jgi:hypothetical protein
MATSSILNAEAFVFCDDLACQWFLYIFFPPLYSTKVLLHLWFLFYARSRAWTSSEKSQPL